MLTIAPTGATVVRASATARCSTRRRCRRGRDAHAPMVAGVVVEALDAQGTVLDRAEPVGPDIAISAQFSRWDS